VSLLAQVPLHVIELLDEATGVSLHAGKATNTLGLQVLRLKPCMRIRQLQSCMQEGWHHSAHLSERLNQRMLLLHMHTNVMRALSDACMRAWCCTVAMRDSKQIRLLLGPLCLNMHPHAKHKGTTIRFA
jgi:hypothetical protein